MKTSNPDFTVSKGEAHDVIDKRLGFPSPLRNGENMGKEFFDEEEVRLSVEGAIEGEDGTGTFETIAREVKLGHGVD